MLFNSHIFIYLFFPTTFFGYFAIARYSHRHALSWLFLMSLFFYGWWDIRYLALLGGSILFNFMAGAAMAGSQRYRNHLLGMAIAANLLVLGWYKYADFFGRSFSLLLGREWESLDIALPLGISFFTFTQIAFLVDVWGGKVREYNFVHYALFVTYFPHLIAGPVLHHKEMMPQFQQAASYRMNMTDVVIGAVTFGIGLFKKVVIADGMQPYVGPVFDAPLDMGLSSDEAWAGALAYTFQLYFDFSGYSDMAIGLSRMFGIILPLNFDSPYKSHNIIEFWRRWHMTLSRFLRDYLYIPLGGSRKGPVRRYINLMTTMLLGGLWHGANWTFVVWGGLHGIYLVINHAWHHCIGTWRKKNPSPHLAPISIPLTFLAVVTAWVFFRALDFEAAWRVLSAMWGMNGCQLPAWVSAPWLESLGCSVNRHALYTDGPRVWYWILFAWLVVWAAPNSQTMGNWLHDKLSALQAAENPAVARAVTAMLLGSATTAVVMLAAVAASQLTSEFIYFNF